MHVLYVFLLCSFGVLVTAPPYAPLTSGVITALTPAASSCLALANGTSCEFYQCFLRRHPCGDFLINTVYRTCKRVEEQQILLNTEGKEWLTNARQCFSDHMKTQYLLDRHDCRALGNAAYSKAMQCANEVTPRLCQVFGSNGLTLKDMFKFSDIRQIRHVGELIVDCGQRTINSLLQRITARLRSIGFSWL